MQNTEGTPKHIEDLIIKFLQKETSEAEIQSLEQWLSESEDHRRQFDEINCTFQAAISLGRFTNQKIDGAWQKLSERINEENNDKSSISFISGVGVWQIAASLVFVIAAAVGIWKYSNEAAQLPDWKNAVVKTDAGNKTMITLPDSSIVWLNANSSLEYDADFGKNSRNVTLKGEAFFDVKKGNKDFIVNTSNLSIQVKGTRFNVNALNNDGNEKATLEEGHIVLEVKGVHKVIDMKPGDQVVFDKSSNNVTLRKVDPTHFSAWKEEALKFENEPLADIASKLENRFKVKIEIDSAIAVRENLTMTIKDENLEEVLELIRLSSSLRYKINGERITIYE